MKITYLGHAGLSIATMGKHLVVDPYISDNPLADKIDLTRLRADYILVTHGHGDHVLDVEKLARSNQSLVISNFEIVSWYEKKGIRGHGMNYGGKKEFDFGTLKYVNAVHSSILPDESYGGNPGGFVLWNEEACIYIAGDTALTQDMKLIPLTCPPLSLAILPIGDNFTMGYEDAVLACDFINCDRILGYHYDTFPPIVINHQQAQSHFTDKGKELILLEIGDSLKV